MEFISAVERLSALAHESRLTVFRRLVERGPAGLPAGEIAAALGVPAPTLSFHLAHLARAGLVNSRREGRSVIYSVTYPAIQELVAYLYENCCGEAGCAPAFAAPRGRSPRSTT